MPDARPQNAPCPVARFQNMPRRKVAKRGALKNENSSCMYVISELNIVNPPGSEMVKAKLSLTVKVIDVASAQGVWPESGSGEPYEFESRLTRVTDRSTRSGVNRQVLRDSGQQIARWFYNFKPETMTEENQDLRLR